jgi:hypothetical protein
MCQVSANSGLAFHQERSRSYTRVTEQLRERLLHPANDGQTRVHQGYITLLQRASCEEEKRVHKYTQVLSVLMNHPFSFVVCDWNESLRVLAV